MGGLADLESLGAAPLERDRLDADDDRFGGLSVPERLPVDDLLAVEVGQVGHQVGEGPGDPVVAPDDDAGHPGERDPFRQSSRDHEADREPDPGERDREVRVVGDEGLAALGQGPRDGPVVGAVQLGLGVRVAGEGAPGERQLGRELEAAQVGERRELDRP